MTTVTIKISGKLATDPAALGVLADEVANLRATGARPCLIHGGGPRISQALSHAGVPEERVRGLRITPPEAAVIVQETMDELGGELTAELAQLGLPAVHVPSTEQRLRAVPKEPVDGVDLGRVGTAVGARTLGLPGHVGGPVPVITPVGTDTSGPLNVNADEGAAVLARELAADLLVLVTDVPGVLGPDGSRIEELTPADACDLLEDGTATGGMIPKLEAAIDALRGGVGRVLLTGLAPGALDGLVSTGTAHGTMLKNASGVHA